MLNPDLSRWWVPPQRASHWQILYHADKVGSHRARVGLAGLGYPRFHSPAWFVALVSLL